MGDTNSVLWTLNPSGWTKTGMGYILNGVCYAWGRWYKNGNDGEVGEDELRFWDWSQFGPDCCYGQGKWMPVTDPDVLASFPEEWKRKG